MSGIQNIRNSLSGNITKVIVISIIITFIGSVGWAGFFSQGTTGTVAKVGSQEISNVDLSFEISNQQFAFEQRFPGQEIDDETLFNISKDILIGKFSVLDFLNSSEMILSDDFIFGQLSEEDQFQENGKFSKNRFDSSARSNGFIPSDYLQRIREDLIIGLWRQSLANSTFLSDYEISKSLSLVEQERSISFVRFPIENIKKSVNFEENDLIEFYENNKESYIDPQKVKTSFISLNTNGLSNVSDITDAEIKSEYDIYLQEFDYSIRKSVSHIMINISDDKSKEIAKAELLKAQTRIQNGENFKDIVLELSEDDGTKNSGGSLGFTDGTLLPPEFEEALLKMEEGDIYGPIELASSLHLIKLDENIEPSPVSYEERADEILEELKIQRAEEKYFSLLDLASELVYQSSSLADISEQISISIEESQHFSRQEIPEKLKYTEVEKFLFEEYESTGYVELIETSDSSAVIVEVSDMIEASQLSFESVKSKIKEAYIQSEASKKSSSLSENLIAELKKGKTFEMVSNENNTTVESYQALKRDSSLLPASAVDKIFSLSRSKTGNDYGSSFAQNGDLLVYRLDDVTDSSNVLDETRINQITDFLNQQKATSEIGELQLSLRNNAVIQGI
tara:strand:+ start:6161 stop:8032 length:1872 start_codon:yes stop_codon:yes gene_type:complete